MGSFIVNGKKYADINDITDEEVRETFRGRIKFYQAFSYRGDWYNQFEDLDLVGQKACKRAAERLIMFGADVRSIPKTDTCYLFDHGAREYHLRIACAFNSIDQSGRVFCLRLIGENFC